MSSLDINTPVINPALTATLMADASHSTSDTRRAVTAELLQATFLVAIVTREVQEKPVAPGQVTWQAGSRFSVLLSNDGQGGKVLPLFTDWDALRQWTDQPVSGLIMPAAEAWAFALADNTYAGAVVNPATDGLFFGPTALTQLAGQPA
jgi:hypothetical protein